ncbi:RidA family protein [Aquimarina sp. 2201CG5-10]|uniref:RidA family protein n=1 Tax=Aquimarina callyspongiae TaxID=3098150 RepID=UPI002AB3DE9B|nr:RidA family protein [Aquimarina sp. 2201CG5-10]MDY8138584.1 RidA family protein [Aquimarina sp. 2201CG5-10]
MKRLYIILAIALLAIGCTNTDTNVPVEAIFHKTHEPKKSRAPFSDAVQVGDLYFLSGQVGMDHATRKLVVGGIKEETKQTLENIKAVLKHHNLEMKDVVKCTVILADIEDFSAFNEVYKTYLPQKPARTTFAAKGLAVGAKIEIECIAVKASK